MDALALLSINTIRTLALDAVQKANSGHPGLPMGSAPMAYVLFQKFLNHNPKDPRWPDRDRFVLSGGHGSMLVYSLLHLTGYDLGLDELKSFRQWGSRTPGHPESFMTPGVEATTGPLGQGSANAVGMAIAERFLAARYNRPGHTIVDHHTYALVSDGDLMEGISHEAASLAGHLKLGKLIYLYDDNLISLDGPTSLSFTEDVAKRYEAYGWQTLRVGDGNTDLDSIEKAIAAAKAETGRPSIILVRTTIGYGSPNKANTHEAHGSPLGPEEVKLTKKALGFDPEKFFFIPDEALANFRTALDRGAKAQSEWLQRFEKWAAEFPELAAEWRTVQSGELPAGWESALPSFTPADKLATRESGGKVITALAAKIPNLLGGDADLSVSTKTGLKGLGNFDGKTGEGRNIRFGVREHAMGAIANGLAYHGGIRPYTATFFCFADYERPALRLAALSHLPVVFVFTHDSIGLGEDGPTHQPIEHLASLRAMPNMWVVRPGDANETVEAWRLALERKSGPTCIVLSRQAVPTVDRSKAAPAAEARKGGYVLLDAVGGAPQAVLIATGSELPIAVEAHEKLTAAGVRARVVSLPCWEAFAAQSKEYQQSVIPAEVPARVSIEAGATFGWRQWIGDRGVAIGLDRFGASAPDKVIYKELGLTADNVVKTVQGLLPSSRA
ncbi:MAG TPA: transketolase [Polyangia bacterium]|nr:transketolase [Polyangia bacterium]